MPEQYCLKYLKKINRRLFIVIVSAITTIFLFNEILDFAAKVLNTPTLLLISIAAFYFLIKISLEEEIWGTE